MGVQGIEGAMLPQRKPDIRAGAHQCKAKVRAQITASQPQPRDWGGGPGGWARESSGARHGRAGLRRGLLVQPRGDLHGGHPQLTVALGGAGRGIVCQAAAWGSGGGGGRGGAPWPICATDTFEETNNNNRKGAGAGVVFFFENVFRQAFAEGPGGSTG